MNTQWANDCSIMVPPSEKSRMCRVQFANQIDHVQKGKGTKTKRDIDFQTYITKIWYHSLNVVSQVNGWAVVTKKALSYLVYTYLINSSTDLVPASRETLSFSIKHSLELPRVHLQVLCLHYLENDVNCRTILLLGNHMVVSIQRPQG